MAEENRINFYKHHIGDYQKKTAALTLAEHGAYLLMLHHHYGTEKPLPTGAALYRLLRSNTKADKAAIDRVVDQFWSKTDAGLVNGRVIEEISKAEGQRLHNQIVGKLGGRPKKQKPEGLSNKNPTGYEMETKVVSETKPGNNPNQTPDSTTKDLKDSSPTGDVSLFPEKGTNGARIPNCPIDEIIRLYHEEIPVAPRVTVRNAGRDKLISGRWRQVFADGKAHNKAEAIELFRHFFEFVRDSKFLTGKAPPQKDRAPFVADLEWLMSPSNFAKTVEGRYHR